jgi:diadenylate cyclase
VVGYHVGPDPLSQPQVAATLDELDALSDTDLLDFTALARAFGYPSTTEAQDSAIADPFG